MDKIERNFKEFILNAIYKSNWKMNHNSQKGFYAKRGNCNIRYHPSLFKSEIDARDVKLYNFHQETIYCKNVVDYMRSFIEFMKDRVIKHCKHLGSVNIFLATFDKNNVFHKLMVVVSNIVSNLLKIKEKINLYQSIIVLIEYEGHPIFMGHLNFTGLE